MRDWDKAYNNMAVIKGAVDIPPKWLDDATQYRTTHASSIQCFSEPGMRYDLVLPDGVPKGLAAFVHGGYWHKFGPEWFTHFAEGARAQGFAVAIIGYTLAPKASIAQMSHQVAAALTHAAAQISGPIYLSGHSAGGHLVSRMMDEDRLLKVDVLARVAHVFAISGLFDLRPLINLSMNDILHLTPEMAMAESPVFKMPVQGIRHTSWVGGDELQVFIRQSELIANVWDGLGANAHLYIDDGKNHLSVIDGLQNPSSSIVKAILT